MKESIREVIPLREDANNFGIGFEIFVILSYGFLDKAIHFNFLYVHHFLFIEFTGVTSYIIKA